MSEIFFSANSVHFPHLEGVKIMKDERSFRLLLQLREYSDAIFVPLGTLCDGDQAITEEMHDGARLAVLIRQVAHAPATTKHRRKTVVAAALCGKREQGERWLWNNEKDKLLFVVPFGVTEEGLEATGAIGCRVYTGIDFPKLASEKGLSSEQTFASLFAAVNVATAGL